MDLTSYFISPFANVLNSSWFLYLCATVLFFLLFREIVTWYWKINKIVDLLEKIEKNTRKENVNSNIEQIRKGPFS